MRTMTTAATTLALAALGAAAGPAAASAATVRLAHTSAGKLLETGSGFTVYMFSRDGRNKDRCVTLSGCAGTWPALTVSGKPKAGAGVRASLLGTISLPNGKHQVTYAGHPLYRYSADSGPGATDYLNFNSFGGTWYGVGAGGGKVK